ncbi:MAG: FtsX-like permease family protein [Myxococcota bacterium]
MFRYFVRALAAMVGKSPVLYGLTVLGVALGVASVVTIQLINDNAIAAFAASVRAVTGDDELTIVPSLGPLHDSTMRVALGDRETVTARPIVRVDAMVGQERLSIVATDLTQPMRGPLEPGAERAGDPLATPGWIALSPQLAGTLGLSVGKTFTAVAGSRRVTLTVGALVDFKKSLPLAPSALAVMDIAQAQSVFALPPGLDEIAIDLADGADVLAAAARIGQTLGERARVLTPDERAEEAAGLLAAFRLNLTALSMISLAVGVFLIHGALQATLLRRRTELGVLRAVGATRRQVVGLVVGEVVLIGLLGTALGLPIGIAAARANIDVVSGTLTNLYLLQAVEELRVPAWVVVLGVAVGLGSALLGATLSLLELRREDTRALLVAATLQESLLALAPRLLAAALALAATTIVFGVVARPWAPAGFVVAVAILATVVLATPWLVLRVSRLARPRGFGVAYSMRALGQKLTSNAFAVASLAIAVSMMFGITAMVGSFRATLETWIGTTVRADIYVSTETRGRLDDDVVRAIAATPGTRAVDVLRRGEARLGARTVRLSGVHVMLPGVPSRWPLMHADDGVLEAVAGGGAVLVSEPLARKAKLSRGQRIRLRTSTGEHELAIAGVFYDYTTEQGTMVVDTTTFERLAGEVAPTSVALYLNDGVDTDATVLHLQARLGDAPVVVRSNQRLRATILDIFDQTFAITVILQAMSFLIAVAGIALTLLIAARERAAELALYRALGATRRQVFRMFVGQGLSLGAFGLVLGAVGGSALVMVLILLINRAYFGWTIRLALPGWALAEQAATILGAAVLAALYPAMRASRTPAQELVRDDL